MPSTMVQSHAPMSLVVTLHIVIEELLNKGSFSLSRCFIVLFKQYMYMYPIYIIY